VTAVAQRKTPVDAIGTEQVCQPQLVTSCQYFSGVKLQPRPWWGATLHDPGDVQQWLTKRCATDEQFAEAAPVSEVVRDRTRLAALQPVMTDFRKVSSLHTQGLR